MRSAELLKKALKIEKQPQPEISPRGGIGLAVPKAEDDDEDEKIQKALGVSQLNQKSYGGKFRKQELEKHQTNTYHTHAFGKNPEHRSPYGSAFVERVKKALGIVKAPVGAHFGRAVAQAKDEGHSSFGEGSEGKKRVREIVGVHKEDKHWCPEHQKWESSEELHKSWVKKAAPPGPSTASWIRMEPK